MGFIFGMQQAGIQKFPYVGVHCYPLYTPAHPLIPPPHPHPLIHTWKKIRNSVSLTKT